MVLFLIETVKLKWTFGNWTWENSVLYSSRYFRFKNH